MTYITHKGKDFLLLPLTDNVSWDPEFPRHLTYRVLDGVFAGEVIEPIYVPGMDMAGEWRADFNAVEVIDSPNIGRVLILEKKKGIEKPIKQYVDLEPFAWDGTKYFEFIMLDLSK